MKSRYAFLHTLQRNTLINVALAVGSSLFTPALRSTSASLILPGARRKAPGSVTLWV